MRHLLVLWMLALTLVLGGCQTASVPVGQPGQITLEFWTLQLESFAPTLQAMFKEYQTQHPHITIRWVDVPFNEGEKRTLTAMMSDSVPDVVNLNPDFTAVLASRKAVLNMNQWVPPSVRDTYLPVAWQAVSLKDYAFGVPWYLTSSVTLYNQQLLKKAGYAAPPRAFSELAPFARALHQKTGAYAVMPTIAESGNFLKELAKLGVPLYNAQGQAVFADHGAAQHLQFWMDLYQARLVPAESITEGHRAAINQYQSNTLAMLLVGPNFLNILKENAQSTLAVTEAAPQFPQDSAVTDFSTMLLAVPRKSAHPKEAVDFALFITNRANQLALAHEAPVLPSITAGLEDPYFQAPPQRDPVARARQISARQMLAATHAYQIHAQQRDINEIINYHVQSALLGKLTAQQAMFQAQQRINALLISP
jgi:putative chitobiose transport system substrate-binding protein